MTELVRLVVEEGVAVITLNRPDRLNALNAETREQLIEAAGAAERDRSARVIVLTGAGRAFCVGADIDRLDELVDSGSKNYDLRRPGNVPAALEDIDTPPELRTAYTFPLGVTKPVIGALNGPAVGAGFVIAVCCDIRFCSDNAFFSAGFGQRGLVAESGVAWLLPRIIGLNNANDFLLSGRRLGAEEALRMGLVSRIETSERLLPATLEYARSMAEGVSPRSMRLIKRQIQEAATQSFAQSSLMAFDLLMESLDHEDFKEGIRSFKEKRPPSFSS